MDEQVGRVRQQASKHGFVLIESPARIGDLLFSGYALIDRDSGAWLVWPDEFTYGHDIVEVEHYLTEKERGR
jgi:hypothetical protein